MNKNAPPVSNYLMLFEGEYYRIAVHKRPTGENRREIENAIRKKFGVEDAPVIYRKDRPVHKARHSTRQS